MKRNLLTAIFCVFILFAFSGCQLAREDMGASAGGDKLAGVFITAEYIDLFDMESYLNDNLKSFQGGTVIAGGNTQKYQGRLYATITNKTLGGEGTGETAGADEYEFGNIKGIAYFLRTEAASAPNGGLVTTTSNDGISDSHVNINSGDDTESISLDGTLYVVPSGANYEYYFNPVYQSPDGSVYLESGDGFMVSNQTYGEGAVFSQKLDETTTVTENGKSKTYSMTVNVSISSVFAPEKIKILQMDADNRILSQTEYTPGSLPEAIAPDGDTDYLIVETDSRDNSGILKTARKIYGRDSESLSAFYQQSDGLCIEQWTQINWN